MKKTLLVLLCLLVLHAGCAVIVGRVAAPSFQKKLNELFGAASHEGPLEYAPDGTPAPRPAREPMRDQLLKFAQQEGVSRDQLQAEFFRRIEVGFETLRDDPDSVRDDPDSDWARISAIWGMVGLQAIADVAAIDRLVSLADRAPPRTRSTLAFATMFALDREAFDKLPGVARQLAKKGLSDEVYSVVIQMVEYPLSLDSTEKAKRLEVLISLLKEGVRDRNVASRTYLDKILLKHDGSYKTSDLRKSLMRDLSRSDNAYDKNYGIRVLQEDFSISGEAAILAIPSLDANSRPRTK